MTSCEICDSLSTYNQKPSICQLCAPVKSASTKYQSPQIEQREIHGVKYFALKDTEIPTDNKYYTPMKSANKEEKPYYIRLMEMFENVY